MIELVNTAKLQESLASQGCIVSHRSEKAVIAAPRLPDAYIIVQDFRAQTRHGCNRTTINSDQNSCTVRRLRPGLINQEPTVLPICGRIRLAGRYFGHTTSVVLGGMQDWHAQFKLFGASFRFGPSLTGTTAR